MARQVVGGKELLVQARPLLNGCELSYGGVGSKVCVYTAREAALANLMPEKKAADTSKCCCVPCPAS